MSADSSGPHSVSDLDTPVLLIESSVLDQNLDRMQALAARYGLKLRPHVKTHKCVSLARRQLALGAVGVAVAKLSEAEVMAAAGIDDIQIANQVVGPLKLDRFHHLAQQIRLSCAVDSEAQVCPLAKTFTSRHPARVFIEVNSGLNRAGVSTIPDAVALARRISSFSTLGLQGLLTHAGHAYAAKSKAELEQVGRSEGEQLIAMANAIRAEGIAVHVISVGSTPTASYVAAVPGVTELRVGNYIFNDMNQVSLGIASVADCALTVLTTVISRPASDRVIIDAGAKALALDRGAHGSGTLFGYGHLVGYEGILSRLSEEHGIIESADRRLKVGDRLRIIPNHACPVVNLFDCLYLVDRDNVVDRLTVDARGRML